MTTNCFLGSEEQRKPGDRCTQVWQPSARDECLAFGTEFLEQDFERLVVVSDGDDAPVDFGQQMHSLRWQL